MSKTKPYRRPAYLEANHPISKRFKKSICSLCDRLYEPFNEGDAPCTACRLGAEKRAQVLERLKS
jgi:hypothetical protein